MEDLDQALELANSIAPEHLCMMISDPWSWAGKVKNAGGLFLGEFSPEVVEQLRLWNKEDKVRIYTIAFLRRNGEDLLRQIARENGGEFRFVSEDDLY